MDLLDRMLGHDQWTTTKILELSQDLTDAQLDQRFDIGHETLRETFDHMIFVVGGWTSAMLGEPAPFEREGRRSIAEMIDQHEQSYPRFAAVARQMCDEERLDEIFIDVYGYPQSVGATIIQVIHHNAQHRSEALHILKRLGVSDLPDGDPQEWEHMTGLITTAS